MRKAVRVSCAANCRQTDSSSSVVSQLQGFASLLGPGNSSRRASCRRWFQDWVRNLSEDDAHKLETWPPHASNRFFDWEKPSHEAYNDPDCNDEYTKPFSKARQRLDYEYHRIPALRRQALQDTILSRVVQASPESGSTKSARRPWLVFSAGSMGVGKGYVLTQLHQFGLVPLHKMLKIDPDMIKSELPELPGYMQYYNPSLAASQVHRESTQMADILLEHVLPRGLSTLVDGSLRDADHYTQLLQRIRTEFPQYRIALIHVVADREIIFQRAADRAVKTGREVPKKLLEESIQQVPKSVRRLAPYTDATFTIENNEHEPLRLVSTTAGTSRKMIDSEGDGNSQSPAWQQFARMWRLDMDNDNTLPPAGQRMICQMAASWNDPEAHEAARQLWGQAYPNFCARCALACDGQCGVCIHGVHVCGCPECRPSQPK